MKVKIKEFLKMKFDYEKEKESEKEGPPIIKTKFIKYYLDSEKLKEFSKINFNNKKENREYKFLKLLKIIIEATNNTLDF